MNAIDLMRRFKWVEPIRPGAGLGPQPLNEPQARMMRAILSDVKKLMDRSNERIGKA